MNLNRVIVELISQFDNLSRNDKRILSIVVEHDKLHPVISDVAMFIKNKFDLSNEHLIYTLAKVCVDFKSPIRLKIPVDTYNYLHRELNRVYDLHTS